MQTIGVVTVVSDEKEINIIAAIANSGPALLFSIYGTYG